MAENNKLCEAIEIAVLSGEELTQEQKNHIENCHNCKALLSQIETMEKDLGTLSVPGLIEGQITEAVMEKVRKEKLSAPIPKFNFTHHLGTAAAVVIILVAALMIKNPAVDTAEKAVVDNTAKSSCANEVNDTESVKQHYLFAAPTEVTAEEEADSITEEATPEVVEEEQSPALKFKAIEPPSGQAQAEETTEETTDGTSESTTVSDEEPSTYRDTGITNDSIETDSGWDSYFNAPKNGYQESAVEEAAVEESAEILTDDTVEDYEEIIEESVTDETVEYSPEVQQAVPAPEFSYEAKESTAEQPASGGGSSGGSLAGGNSSANSFILHESYPVENEKSDNSSVDSIETDEIHVQSIFEGIVFLGGEENFDHNISLANSRLFELYGEKHMLTRELLASYGCTTNEDFLSFIYSYSVS